MYKKCVVTQEKSFNWTRGSVWKMKDCKFCDENRRRWNFFRVRLSETCEHPQGNHTEGWWHQNINVSSRLIEDGRWVIKLCFCIFTFIPYVLIHTVFKKTLHFCILLQAPISFRLLWGHWGCIYFSYLRRTQTYTCVKNVKGELPETEVFQACVTLFSLQHLKAICI